MKPIRQVLADMPELAAFRERLQSDEPFTDSERAEAEHALAVDRARRQSELPLERAA
jgi:hypothetical protein